ncbi:MAG: hypothetical protein KGH75_11000 [Rhodospirillales bacterium]|nr:hypothetical protein [Rhodospirillales bacterium]
MKEVQTHRRDLNSEDRENINLYMNTSSNINSLLRTGRLLKGSITERIKPEVKKIIKSIQKAPKFKLGYPTVVYRGITKKSYSNLKTGKVYKDKGFVSTTFISEIADDFNDGKNYQARIFLTSRDEGAYLPVLCNRFATEPEFKFKDYTKEHELLLPKGTTFKVLGHSYNSKLDKYFVNLQVVSNYE